MDKRGAILIDCYSDYYCRGLFYSSVSLWFHFYCFVDSVVFFTSSKQVSTGPTDFQLGICNVKSDKSALQGAFVSFMERV